MSVSEEFSSPPLSREPVKWIPTAPLYSFTPPKSTTPRRVSEESAVDFETEYPPLGTHGRVPRKRRTSTQSSTTFTLPPRDLPPTLMRIMKTPPPAPFKVLSPMPNRKPVSTFISQTVPDLAPSTPFAEPDRIEEFEESTPTSIRPTDMEPQPLTNRNKSPFYLTHPPIIDGQSLLAAVQENPEAIYLNICTFMHNLNEAEAQLKSVTEDYRGAIRDYECERATWDKFLRVEKAKQVVIWKFIDRIQRGDAKDTSSGLPADSKKKNHANLGTYGNENRIAQLSEAVNEAVSIGENYPPSVLPVFDTTSNGSGMAGSVEWPMGMDPSARIFIPVPPISPNEIISRRKPSGLSSSTINNIIGMLPPRFYGVCPTSLISSAPCPLSPCNLARICDSYNDESRGMGCARLLSGRPCRYVHEYRTCVFEVDESRCYVGSPGKYGGGLSEGYCMMHSQKRVHESQCDVEEWRAREMVAGLRDVHLQGVYNEQ